MGKTRPVDYLAVACLAYICIGLLSGGRKPRPVVIAPDRQVLLEGDRLPSYFKAKEALLTPVRNQRGCASCWAFSFAEMLADTVSLSCGGKWREHLSPQYLLSCTNIHYGCKVGGSPEDLWDLPQLTEKGMPLEADMPYQEKVTTCADSGDGFRVRTVRGTGIDICKDPALALPGFRQSVIDSNVINMKRALIQFGPICGTLRITEGLYRYKGDCIYVDDGTEPTLGMHCVEVVGWSDAHANVAEPGFDAAYWIIRNSYSAEWAGPMFGFCYVAMGINTAQIESRASVCDVEIPASLKEFADGYNHWNSYYTSYGEYVSDPDKQNFIDPDRKALLERIHAERMASGERIHPF